MLGLAFHALPPDVTVVGQRDVGEHRVADVDRAHRVGVGLLVGARCDAEEAVLRVDRPQPAVRTDAHPGDVVAQRLDLPAGDGRREHREVGLAAGARKRGRDVVGLLLGRDELEDQHVLGEPALVTGHRRRDAKCVAFLAQQGVAAVTGAVAPDHPLLGEVGDVLRVVARPWDVILARLERRPDRVQARDEVGVELFDPLEHVGAHPGHDPHRRDDVGRVGDLDAEHRGVGLEVTHHERDHVEGAAAHAAAVELGHQRLHLGRRHPVVRRAGVGLLDRADVGAVLDACDIAGVGGAPERVRLLDRVQLGQGTGSDELARERLPLRLGAVTPVDVVRLGEGSHLVDPGQQPNVRCCLGGLERGSRRFSCHAKVPFAHRGGVKQMPLSRRGIRYKYEHPRSRSVGV